MIFFIKRLILTLLLLPLFLIILFYLIIQTQFVAPYISHWLSQKSQYTISIGRINHSVSAPNIVTLEKVTVSLSNMLILSADQVTLNFSHYNKNELVFNSILLKQGELHTLANLPTYPIKSHHLYLQQMKLVTHQQNYAIQADRVNAEIKPWAMSAQLIADNSEFDFSATQLQIAGLAFNNIISHGKYQQNRWLLENVSADFAHGQLTGSLNWDKEKINIQAITLNNIKWQFNQSLAEMWSTVSKLPEITIEQLAIFNTSLEGKNWAINDASLLLEQINLSQGLVRPNSNEDSAKVSFYASQFQYDNTSFDEIIASFIVKPDKIIIKQINSRLLKGLFRTRGLFVPSTSCLKLDELVFIGIEYAYTVNNKQHLLSKIAKLNCLDVAQIDLKRNYLIYADKLFPFQISALDGHGTNLMLIKNNQLGLWNGSLTINARQATINKINIQLPQMSLSANQNVIQVDEFSTLFPQGILEASATIQANSLLLTKLNATGYQIPPALLYQWGWLADNLLITDSKYIDFSLKLSRQISQPLNAELTITDELNNNDYYYTLP